MGWSGEPVRSAVSSFLHIWEHRYFDMLPLLPDSPLVYLAVS